MTGPRILVIDDEPQIQRFLKPALSAAGYETIAALTGKDGLKAAATKSPDVVLLDLGLPDMDGKLVLQDLRGWSKAPVIVLSARDLEAEKIAALDLGADDYVNKPFAIGELLARLRAALRHAGQQATSGAPAVIHAHDLVIDTNERTVARGGKPVKLTPKEFELFLMLARNAGRIVTHRQVLTAVWGPAHAEDVQYLRVFIGQLRQKLEIDADHPKLILTEPAIGYRVVLETD